MNILRNKYESLVENDLIILNDGIECIVTECCDSYTMLQRMDDHSKHFPIFHDELCEKDQFKKLES